MTIEIRQVSHPDAVRHFDTEELRRDFLIERRFASGEVVLTYSHIDRFVVGGAMPRADRLILPTASALGTDAFLKRRELGVINIGGAGRAQVENTMHELSRRDCLYGGMGSGEVAFESVEVAS